MITAKDMKGKLLIFAPLIGGLLVIIYNSYMVLNPPYQFAFFQELRGFKFWFNQIWMSFLTGYFTVSLSILISGIFIKTK